MTWKNLRAEIEQEFDQQEPDLGQLTFHQTPAEKMRQWALLNPQRYARNQARYNHRRRCDAIDRVLKKHGMARNQADLDAYKRYHAKRKY